MPPKEKKIDGLNSITSGLEKLKKDFKPEYAGLGVFGFGADLELEAARRGLGKKEANDAARWWGRYSQYQAPNRHALFGATLTGASSSSRNDLGIFDITAWLPYQTK